MAFNCVELMVYCFPRLIRFDIHTRHLPIEDGVITLLDENIPRQPWKLLVCWMIILETAGNMIAWTSTTVSWGKMLRLELKTIFFHWILQTSEQMHSHLRRMSVQWTKKIHQAIIHIAVRLCMTRIRFP